VSDVDKWYRNYWARLQERQRLFLTLSAPCVSTSQDDELNEAQRIIFDRTKNALRILDFGAGDNRLKRKFVAADFQGSYETLDFGDSADHTYSSLSQVNEKFDAIICLEVIEHMTLNDYVDLMDEFGRLLNPNGLLVISTPNPLCVVPTWSLDAGHIQQYPLADLAADFVVRGFDVEAFRVWQGPWPKSLRKRMRLFVMRGPCYLLSVDYAHGILVIGKKTRPALSIEGSQL
jgi:2-polyprenyl-3-methyl-5-hydroxy-6-metoxy-1,4-benzoquinol methylase